MAAIMRFKAKDTLHFLSSIMQKLREVMIFKLNFFQKIPKSFTRNMETLKCGRQWGVHPMAGKDNSSHTIAEIIASLRQG